MKLTFASRAAALLLLAAVGAQGCTAALPPTASGTAATSSQTNLDPAASSFQAAPPLPASSVVVGQAVSPDGPLVNAAVVVLPVTGGDILGTTSTDATGHFVVPAGGLPPATPVRVEVQGAPSAGAESLTLRSLAVTIDAPVDGALAAPPPASYRVAQATGSETASLNETPKLTNIEPRYAGKGQKILLTGTGFNRARFARPGDESRVRVLSDSEAVLINQFSNDGALAEYAYTDLLDLFDMAGNRIISRGILAKYSSVGWLPGIEKVSPSHLSSAGGEEITIYGEGFTTRKMNITAQLRMNTEAGETTVPLTNVRIVDDTQIKAVTPRAPGGAGPADVLLVTDKKPSANISNVVVLRGGDTVEGITFFEPPTLTGISPVIGNPAGGDTFTLTGSGFNQRTKVRIQGQPVTDLTFVDAHTLRGKTPRSTALGASDVVVEGGDNTPSALTATLKGAFVYNDLVPSVSRIAPALGPTTGGTAITITGANFDGTTTVTLGGKPLENLKWVDAKTITGATPAGTAGSQDLVTSSNGKQYTLKGGFTYNAATCPSGQILGKNGCEAVPAVVVDASSTVALTAMLPILNSLQSVAGKTAVAAFENSAAYKNLLAAVSTALATSSHSDMAGYLRWAARFGDVRPLPDFVMNALTSDPTVVKAFATAVNDVNTQVKASGKTLSTDAATSITLGNTSISLSSGSSTSGSGSGGSSGSAGSSGSSGSGGVSAPTIATVASATHPVAGGNTVTITGTNLTGATSVTFGGVAGTSLSVVSATQLTVVAPAGTGKVNVAVTTPGGTATSTGGYLYAPTLTSVSPTSGAAAGGTTVTLTGTGFTNASSVTFGTNDAASVTFVNDTSLTVTTPAGSGLVDVVVTTTSGSATGAFTYLPAPTISGISPGTGTLAGGETITITGTNLGSVTSVTFGGSEGSNLVLVSPTQITVDAPANGVLITGGAVDVVVTSPGGTATAVEGYTYDGSGGLGGGFGGGGP